MNNPYESTNTMIHGQVSPKHSHSLQLDTNGQIALNAAKGWVRFFSVMGFISFAFVILGMLGTLFTLGKTGGFGLIITMVFVVMALVIFKLANSLSKYSSAITRVMLNHDPYDFERAMEEQMKFWRLFGILNLIWIVFIIIGFFSSI